MKQAIYESTKIKKYGIYIAGEWTAPDRHELVSVENPSTEEIIAQVPAGTPEDAVRAVRAARDAFDKGPWGRSTPEDRKIVLERFLSILERRAPELVEIIIAECGSTRDFAESAQVSGAISHLRSTIKAMNSFEWEKPTAAHIGNGIGQGMIIREPYGVATLISAYNFPLWLSMTKLAAALAAGCTVILKPATTTPLSGLALAEIGEEAGLPKGVLNVVTGGREANKVLVSHPSVDMVSFTGSETVGSQIYAQAADSLKKVVLELGGKSANIVLDDADLNAVADQVVAGTTKQAGQGCSLLTRTLVHRSRHDELVDLVAQKLSKIQVGDASGADTDMGPLISAEQRQKVEDLIAVGVAEGATIVSGGKRPEHLKKGYFIEPTLFTNVHNEMRIAREEFFGPVNVVIPFDIEEEAIQLANDNPFGLSAAVNSNDPVRAYQVARKIRAGGVVVNGGGGAFPNTSMPFGGYKASGLGREYGQWGIDEYLETKSISWGIARG